MKPNKPIIAGNLSPKFEDDFSHGEYIKYDHQDGGMVVSTKNILDAVTRQVNKPTELRVVKTVGVAYTISATGPVPVKDLLTIPPDPLFGPGRFSFAFRQEGAKDMSHMAVDIHLEQGTVATVEDLVEYCPTKMLMVALWKSLLASISTKK